MEAVYTLLDIDRGVPEVYASTYDIRKLLAATSRLRDGKELKVPLGPLARKWLAKKLEYNQVGDLLKEYDLID